MMMAILKLKSPLLALKYLKKQKCVEIILITPVIFLQKHKLVNVILIDFSFTVWVQMVTNKMFTYSL